MARLAAKLAGLGLALGRCLAAEDSSALVQGQLQVRTAPGVDLNLTHASLSGAGHHLLRAVRYSMTRNANWGTSLNFTYNVTEMEAGSDFEVSTPAGKDGTGGCSIT